MLRLPPLVHEVQSHHRDRVTVSGTIMEVDPNHHSGSGAWHQIFSVKITDVMADKNHTGIEDGQIVNVAIRFGDGESLPDAIPDLTVGAPITLCGAYVPADEAYPQADGDRAAVIHFTHHPFGWVEYQGKRYE